MTKPVNKKQAASQTIPPESPCVNICRIDENTGWCDGCWRTLDEIIVWGKASTTTKNEIMDSIRQRQTSLLP